VLLLGGGARGPHLAEGVRVRLRVGVGVAAGVGVDVGAGAAAAGVAAVRKYKRHVKCAGERGLRKSMGACALVWECKVQRVSDRSKHAALLF
jgi:hypothetical protein